MSIPIKDHPNISYTQLQQQLRSAVEGVIDNTSPTVTVDITTKKDPFHLGDMEVVMSLQAKMSRFINRELAEDCRINAAIEATVKDQLARDLHRALTGDIEKAVLDLKQQYMAAQVHERFYRPDDPIRRKIDNILQMLRY